MEFRTILAPIEVRLPIVSHGGRARYLGGAFRAAPDPLVEGLALIQKRCPSFPLELQPAVAAGVAEGFAETLTNGRRFCCARLEPDLLKYHDVDTTDEACRTRTRSFISSCLWHAADPIPFAEAWKAAGVLGLAQAYRSTAEADALPVLADALEEAGCDLPFLLKHLRTCPDHGESCWVFELLLGPA